MAKTGMNIEKCNVYKAEKHNGRDNKYIAAVNDSPNKTYSIFADMTPTNKTWRNPDERYKDKTLVQLLNDIRKEVKEKTGKKLQEKDRTRKVKDKKTGEFKEIVIPGSAPIREGVCPVKEDTKIEDFQPVIDWLAERHVKVIRIDIHNDEGHVDIETKERKYNRHAHVIFDWMLHEDVEFKDPKTEETKIQKAGTSVKLNQRDMSELQTILAEALSMERGEPKEVTGAEHLRSLEYRLQETAKDLERLTKKNEVLKKENEDLKEQKREELRKSCSNLQLVGKNNVIQFDRTIHLANGAVPPTEQEKAARDSLAQESKRDLSEMTQAQLVTEDAQLRRLIDSTYQAIDRIGKKIIEIANNIPKLSIFSSRQREMLAREAALEQKVADTQSEAKKLVEQARIDQETAIKEAQRIANEKVAAVKEETRLAKESAIKAETEAKKRSTAALTREQAARDEAKKYEVLNASLEQKISEAWKAGQSTGYQEGYTEGERIEKAKTTAKQQEIDTLKTSHDAAIANLQAQHKEEKEKLEKLVRSERTWKELFRRTNPRLNNVEQNFKELKLLKDWPLTDQEIIKIISGYAVEKTHSEVRNYKKIQLPVRIEIAESSQGIMKVWYNEMSLEDCKKDLQEKVIRLGKGNGIGGPK